MKVWELGEFGLIERIACIVGKASRDDVILGIGDDASVWRPGGADQIGTTDVLIQDVHFTLKTATWRDLGWKSLAVNISDIAAMGGTPSYALVSLGLPPELPQLAKTQSPGTRRIRTLASAAPSEAQL